MRHRATFPRALAPLERALTLAEPEGYVRTFVDGIAAHADALERLGSHMTGVGCASIKDLEAVDLPILEAIIARSYATLKAGTTPSTPGRGGRT